MSQRIYEDYKEISKEPIGNIEDDSYDHWRVSLI